VTRDEHGRAIRDEGTVIFADADNEWVITGKNAPMRGIWMFPIPEEGVLVYGAQVKYIRRKKKN